MEFQAVKIVENSQHHKNNKLKDNYKTIKENWNNFYKEKENSNSKKDLRNSSYLTIKSKIS
jgi:hypothetical protein